MAGDFITYDGPNMVTEDPSCGGYPDMYCPAVPGDTNHFNFWKSSCKQKQLVPELKSCFGGCKVHGKVYLAHRTVAEEVQAVKRKERIHLTMEQVLKLYSYFDQGLTNQEILYKMEMSVDAINRRRRKWINGEPPKARGVQDEDKIKIKELYLQGISSVGIAKQIPYTAITIRKYLREFYREDPEFKGAADQMERENPSHKVAMECRS